MFLLDSLLMAPGRAVLFLLEEVAKKAQEEFLDDDSVKQELQEIYAMLEAGKISEKDFEAREYRLVERLQQIAAAKFHEHTAGLRAAIGGDPEALADLARLASDAGPLASDAGPLVLNSLPGVPDLPIVDALPSAPAPAPSPLPVEPPVAVAPPAPVAPPPPVAPFAPVSPFAPVAPPAPIAPPSHAAAPPAMTMGQVIECATRGLSMLKMKVSSITSAAHDESGWRVTAELVERRGVPDSSDLLGVYELHLDHGGNLLRYERTRMRRRCDLGR